MLPQNQTVESQSTAIETDRKLQAEGVLRAVVVADEYGDPVIQGDYSGQDQLNIDALLPGRKEVECDSLSAEDANAIEATAAAKLAQKKALGKAFIGTIFGAPLLIWLVLNLTSNSHMIKTSAQEVGSVSPAAINTNKITMRTYLMTRVLGSF